MRFHEIDKYPLELIDCEGGTRRDISTTGIT